VADPFEEFARERGLQLRLEPINLVPRNVVAPLDAIDRHYLAELFRAGEETSAVRMVFALLATTDASPSLRDVLWWLAGDAWVVERSDGRLEEWASVYGYPAREAATARLFDLHRRQSKALFDLLGELDGRRLLALYEAELAPE
jgi:hypothetical protein